MDENLLLAEDVAAQLAEDSRTTDAVIEVIAEHGVITLLGDVKSELIHAAAEEIAKQHVGVLAVVNGLEVHVAPNKLQYMSVELGGLINKAFGAMADVDQPPSKQ